jgi:hypothetical protein
MYKGLTVKTPGCVAFSLPVQRRNFRDLGASSVFPIPPRPAQRAAAKEWRFPARAASGPRLPSCSRDGFRNGVAGYRAARRRYAVAGERLGAAPGLQRQTRRHFCRQSVQTGRRFDAPDCSADDPRKNRAEAERKLRASLCSRIALGGAPRLAFWPSPHPRIRWTVASPGRAICACRDTRPPPPRVPKCPTKC